MHGLFSYHMDVTLDSIRDIQLFQSKAGYRFSVDALLLFDFIRLKRVSKIADLGAGSGIVGILLAKKFPKAKITLVEIQPGLCELAERNVDLNNVGRRVHISRHDFRKLPEDFFKKYDLVVSNPPFRKMKTGRLNIAEERTIARHEITMNLDTLIKSASSLLREKGRFCIIYQPWRIAELLMNLHERGFEPKRLQLVHSHPVSEAKMLLLEAVKAGRCGLKVEKPFFIYTANGAYSEEMRMIYQSGNQ